MSTLERCYVYNETILDNQINDKCNNVSNCDWRIMWLSYIPQLKLCEKTKDRPRTFPYISIPIHYGCLAEPMAK
jgi:hypothetical protein